MRSTSVAIVTLLLALGACNKAGKGKPDDNNKPNPSLSKAAVDGVQGRRIDIEVGKEDYKPSSVSVKAGEQITLVFTRTTDETCGTSVKFPALHIDKSLPLNQPVAIAIKPDKAGEIGFACGMDMMQGKIVVTEN
jgi:plastocyanin domain-containing protein